MHLIRLMRNPLTPLFLIVIISSIIGLGCTGQKEPTVFTISGNVKNPKVGKIILTQEEDISRKKTKFIDEIKVDANGTFEKGFNIEPHIYTLDFYGKEKIKLAINKGQKIVIEANGNDLKNVKIFGSEDTEKLHAYEKLRKESLNRLVISVRDRLKATGDYNNTESEADGNDEVTNYEKHKAELNEFIKTEMGDSIALYSTSLRWDDGKISFFETLVGSFEKKHGDIEITKRLKEKIALLKATSVGGNVADIEMPDKDGEIVKFDPSKSKLTLIDFWASWCGPCRRESKTVAALYEKYKAKGFEIYSVSLDDKREKWLEAIEQDGRIWTNVSSLKGFETPATFDYAVTSLPAKFLVDSEGKIVAKNLHGKELGEKLESLLAE